MGPLEGDIQEAIGTLDQRGGIFGDWSQGIGMDEETTPGKVERESRESPGQSPKNYNLGAWPRGGVNKGDGGVGKALSGASSRRDDSHRVKTEVFSLALFHYYG